jgi:hypothetical protein
MKSTMLDCNLSDANTLVDMVSYTLCNTAQKDSDRSLLGMGMFYELVNCN